MKKLNNKGMTLIEIVLCFTLTSIIAISMLNIILNYKTRQEIESLNRDVVSYTNNITNLVQNDIALHHLEDVDITRNKNYRYTIYTIKMTFTKNFDDDPEFKEKTLSIYQSNGQESVVDYIVYTNDSKEDIKYSLNDYGDEVISISSSDNEYLKHLRFGNIDVDMDADSLGFLVIDIPIYHHELGSKHHILIKAPKNQ